MVPLWIETFVETPAKKTQTSFDFGYQMKTIAKPSFESWLDEETKSRIRTFPGCNHLELWRATKPDNIFFTYSYWDSEDALNAYRYSELFIQTWANTKPLFQDRAEAWSIEVQAILD